MLYWIDVAKTTTKTMPIGLFDLFGDETLRANSGTKLLSVDVINRCWTSHWKWTLESNDPLTTKLPLVSILYTPRCADRLLTLLLEHVDSVHRSYNKMEKIKKNAIGSYFLLYPLPVSMLKTEKEYYFLDSLGFSYVIISLLWFTLACIRRGSSSGLTMEQTEQKDTWKSTSTYCSVPRTYRQPGENKEV